MVNNVLYVSHGDEGPLYSKSCEVKDFNWIPCSPRVKEFECTAKFRYRQGEQAVKVTVITSDRIHIDFKEKQRAVTEGQYAVLYDGDKCIGGGVIVSAEY